LSVAVRAVLIGMGAGLIQGTTGFGFGLFSVGLLVLMMPVADAVVIAAIMSLASTLLNLWSLRGDVDWRDARPIILASLPTTLVGIYLLKSLPSDILQIGIVVMILAGCAVSLWSPRKAINDREFPWAYLAGLVGGLFGGALNMGGPPGVLYALLRGWEKGRSKGLMVTYFAVTGVIRVVLFVATGVATPQALRISAIVMLPALVTAYLGVLVFRRLSSRMFRYAAMAVLMGIAVKIVVT